MVIGEIQLSKVDMIWINYWCLYWCCVYFKYMFQLKIHIKGKGISRTTGPNIHDNPVYLILINLSCWYQIWTLIFDTILWNLMKIFTYILSIIDIHAKSVTCLDKIKIELFQLKDPHLCGRFRTGLFTGDGVSMM